MYLCSAQKYIGGIWFYKHAQEAIQAAKGQKHQCSKDKKMSQGSIVSVHSLSRQCSPPPHLSFKIQLNQNEATAAFLLQIVRMYFKDFW